MDTLPDRQQQQDEYREHHLHVGDGGEAKCTHHNQLQDLEDGEHVHLSLWHTADVVVGWVRSLQYTEHTSTAVFSSVESQLFYSSYCKTNQLNWI